jgi:hypothetical protein
MVQESLVPWLRQRLGLPSEGASLTLRFVGIGQSAIDAVLREKLHLPSQVVVASQFEGNRVDFTLSLPDSSPASVAQLTRLLGGIQEHLGAHLYATNQISLEEAALRPLLDQRERLAVVEMGGPHLAAALSRFAATRPVLAASFAAHSTDDLERLLELPVVSESNPSRPQERLERLGNAARLKSDARWVLVLGAPEPTEGDRSVVRVGVGLPGGRWEHWRLTERTNPESGRTSLINDVLDHFRKIRP